MKKNPSSLIFHLSTNRGFTLIELLVVISIISVLATLLMANFVGIRQRGRDAQRKSDLRQIQSALELYRSDTASYPASLPACGSSLTSGSGTTYLQKIPCDPLTGTSYAYTFESGNNTYRIYGCLENVNDSQRDANDGALGDQCEAGGLVSHTVRTP